MEKTQTLEEFYRAKHLPVPDGQEKEIGHFNVFDATPFIGDNPDPLPYSRRDFYKIALICGKTRFLYADKVIDVEENAIVFANPLVPYQCDHITAEPGSYFCVFTEAFLRQFTAVKLLEYPVFKPGGQPVVYLPKEQVPQVRELFEKMLAEKQSDYTYKYDLLCNYTLELIHTGLKLQPVKESAPHGNAAGRISTMFTDLLERQFPIESPVQQVNFRTAIDFANQLSVHVNHLNKALKDTTGKSTSELIAERIVQEAKMLLRHTDWNVSEIGYCLGFQEPAHFNNFFKKKTQITPRSFRTV